MRLPFYVQSKLACVLVPFAATSLPWDPSFWGLKHPNSYLIGCFFLFFVFLVACYVLGQCFFGLLFGGKPLVGGGGPPSTCSEGYSTVGDPRAF